MENSTKTYRINKEALTSGTAEAGQFSVAPARLVEVFGDDAFSEADGYKIDRELVFENNEGRVFRVYAYKATSMYEEGYPAPAEFWTQTAPFVFGVGCLACHSAKIGEFTSWLSGEILKTSEQDPEAFVVVMDPETHEEVSEITDRMVASVKSTLKKEDVDPLSSRETLIVGNVICQLVGAMVEMKKELDSSINKAVEESEPAPWEPDVDVVEEIPDLEMSRELAAEVIRNLRQLQAHASLSDEIAPLLEKAIILESNFYGS